MSATPTTRAITTYRHPPRLGEHTKEVLAGVGYDDAKLVGLKEWKVRARTRRAGSQATRQLR